jgi:hypothetical protein
MKKTNRYHELRTRSSQQVEEEQLEFQVEESKQQIEGDLLATKRSLAAAKQELIKAESAYPFNSKTVVEAELKIEGYEAGLKRLEAIKDRLFGENSTQEASVEGK